MELISGDLQFLWVLFTEEIVWLVTDTPFQFDAEVQNVKGRLLSTGGIFLIEKNPLIFLCKKFYGFWSGQSKMIYSAGERIA